MPLLVLENVHTYYGNVHALKGISLTVEEGEIVTLIGANGAGKTTTLKTISGLIKPREGKIIFDGHELNRIPAHKIVHMGISHAPEGRKIFPTLTVEENLMLGAYSLGNDRKTIETNKERVFALFPRLAERRKQLAGTLSGGEQQMLAIGRALMSKPRLLLLDEPSLGLAPMLVKAIFETIKEINRQGVTILLVEQNAKAALKLAHRAYVLETGRIVLSGFSHELVQDERVRKAYLGER
ncbi:MAG: ABC transporter ATP-binding protein [Anaerolineae bacterium]|nr:ABC transporter ATP-binding protein [Anaerolineae bacterium]MDW8101943.1 ABC transporter ATP-binding protein [Anaerolineae bacterium]